METGRHYRSLPRVILGRLWHDSLLGRKSILRFQASTEENVYNFLSFIWVVSKDLHCQLEHLLGICPGEVLLDLQVVLCPVFWGTARLISRMVVPACNPCSCWGFCLFVGWLVWFGLILFLFFKTESLHVVLAVLELAVSTRLALNSETYYVVNAEGRVVVVTTQLTVTPQS
jgi:hypothetical protein